MAEDASEYLASLSRSVSSLAPPSFLFRSFACTSEFLSYLILCVVKMPFIPPVSITRSVSGLTGKERSVHSSSSSKTRESREDRAGSSVKERLTLNLKQLGKKSQPRSHLPTAGKAAPEVPSRRRDRPVPSSQTDSFPASSSGESLSKAKEQRHGTSEAKTRPERREAEPEQEEVRFTLTLAPEAVLLLQRRNSERHQRSAARRVAEGSADVAADPRRRKEGASKRHPPRHGAPSGRPAAPAKGAAQLGDITSFVKISLLNERHKYDDVEYEDEGDYGVDERVVLKCTEWLRGLENSPVTVGNGVSASSVKTF